MAWDSFSPLPAKATFSFRGIFSALTKCIRYSPAASAQGSTSKRSPGTNPARGEQVTFRGKSPPPPMVTMPTSRACSITAHTVSWSKSWNCMVCPVVKCTRGTEYSRMALATKASFSCVTRPAVIRSRSILACPPFWA